MSTAATSLEKSFREACGFGPVAGAEMDAGQLDMLRDADGKLPANVFQIMRKGGARGPGRPTGAGNKRNKKLAEMICQRSGDPVLFMSDLYAMPLDQMVELLRIADNSADREERLMSLVEEVGTFMRIALAKSMVDGAAIDKLTNLVDRVGDIAGELKSKPGQLAVSALALQLQAARATAEYVHGKQPVSVHIEGKADMVLLIPGLNAPITEGTGELAQAVAKYGVECIDVEGMKLIPNFDGQDDDDGDDDGGEA